VLKIFVENQFKKDIKKISKSGTKKIEKIKRVIKLLENELPLESKYKQHKLSNNCKDHLECHIEPDWLMIYKIDKNNKELILVRIGSHSELFK